MLHLTIPVTESEVFLCWDHVRSWELAETSVYFVAEILNWVLGERFCIGCYSTRWPFPSQYLHSNVIIFWLGITFPSYSFHWMWKPRTTLSPFDALYQNLKAWSSSSFQDRSVLSAAFLRRLLADESQLSPRVLREAGLGLEPLHSCFADPTPHDRLAQYWGGHRSCVPL